MRTWTIESCDCEVEEKSFDFDLHVFDVIKNGSVIATIVPGSLEDMGNIVVALNAGESIKGWEDGMGNTISI